MPAITFARRAAYSSAGKISLPRNTGCASGPAALSAMATTTHGIATRVAISAIVSRDGFRQPHGIADGNLAAAGPDAARRRQLPEGTGHHFARGAEMGGDLLLRHPHHAVRGGLQQQEI